MPESLIDQIKRHEGLRLKLYVCPAGKLTIGYGRNLEERGITDDEALLMLHNDIMSARNEVNALSWFRGLDGVRQDVIVNMAFNLGLTKLLGFKKMIAAIKTRDYSTAAIEMLDSKWYADVGDRAVELARIMEEG
jgi:lysozyme